MYSFNDKYIFWSFPWIIFILLRSSMIELLSHPNTDQYKSSMITAQRVMTESVLWGCIQTGKAPLSSTNVCKFSVRAILYFNLELERSWFKLEPYSLSSTPTESKLAMVLSISSNVFSISYNIVHSAIDIYTTYILTLILRTINPRAVHYNVRSYFIPRVWFTQDDCRFNERLVQ